MPKPCPEPTTYDFTRSLLPCYRHIWCFLVRMLVANEQNPPPMLENVTTTSWRRRSGRCTAVGIKIKGTPRMESLSRMPPEKGEADPDRFLSDALSQSDTFRCSANATGRSSAGLVACTTKLVTIPKPKIRRPQLDSKSHWLSIRTKPLADMPSTGSIGRRPSSKLRPSI